VRAFVVAGLVACGAPPPETVDGVAALRVYAADFAKLEELERVLRDELAAADAKLDWSFTEYGSEAGVYSFAVEARLAPKLAELARELDARGIAVRLVTRQQAIPLVSVGSCLVTPSFLNTRGRNRGSTRTNKHEIEWGIDLDGDDTHRPSIHVAWRFQMQSIELQIGVCLWADAITR
jgi:hypothetical protein